MVRTLLVLIVPVLLLVGGYQLISGRLDPVPVDQEPALSAAQRAGVPVIEPTGLSEEWVPLSAVFQRADEGGTLRLGYLTPTGKPVQVVQSTLPSGSLLAAELSTDPDASTPDAEGTVTVGGATWQRYPGRPGEAALVRTDGALTVLVFGPAPVEELSELAEAFVRG